MAITFNEDGSISNDGSPVLDTGRGAYPGGPVAQDTAGDVNAMAQRYGISAGETDAANLAAKNPEDRAKYLADLDAQYQKRAAPNAPRQFDSQSAQGNALYGSGTGNRTNTPGGAMTGGGGAAASARASYPAFNNSSPTFDDPASRMIEDYALDRFRSRMNPDPNSGTAGYESYAKQLIDTLKGPVYSASDESIIKTKAFDSMEQERGQVKQRWLEEMSRRGISPSSGIALDGLLKIDNHYQGLRTQVESSFAQNAIDQTRQQRSQVLDVYGQLANSEEGRQREALTYATLPYELQNNSFQRNLQLVGAGGSPQSLLQSALGIYGAGQQADALRSQQQQTSTAGMLQLLGYLFPS